MSWKTEKSFTFRKNNLHTVIHTVSKSRQTERSSVRPSFLPVCFFRYCLFRLRNEFFPNPFQQDDTSLHLRISATQIRLLQQTIQCIPQVRNIRRLIQCQFSRQLLALKPFFNSSISSSVYVFFLSASYTCYH